MRSGSPRVLVVSASRHGATREIAASLARTLADCDASRRAGVDAVAVPVEQQPDPAGYDAIVVGSAVYFGRWLDPRPSVRRCVRHDAAGSAGVVVLQWPHRGAVVSP